MKYKGAISTGVIIVLLSSPFLFRPYVVSGGSMEPTYHEGQLVLVESLTPYIYIWRGEVLVIRNPHDHTQTEIKRVVGLPGETVSMGAQGVTINPDAATCPKGAPLYVLKGPCKLEFLAGTVVGGSSNGDFTLKLGPEDYMVLGDNRGKSEDSRAFGAVQQTDSIGHVILAL
jgi:signal peptidase I